jgi:tetratricopeptide (TPR) repeat protein
MRRPLLILLFLFVIIVTFAQDASRVSLLIKQGRALNDSNRFKAAGIKFDSALAIDQNNIDALVGKTTSCMGLDEYYKTIDQCEFIFKKFKKQIKHGELTAQLKEVYVNYAEALNDISKYDEGIEQCDKALVLYPKDFRLYFAKGACLSNNKKEDEAVPYLEKAIIYDTILPGQTAPSDFTLGRISYNHGKHVQSVMALCKYVAEHPRSSKAKWAMEMITEQMNGNSSKTKEGGTIVYIDKSMLGDTSKDGRPFANDFHKTSMILATMGIMNGLDSMMGRNRPQAFMSRLRIFCSSLKDNRDSGSGFYWNYYGSYFVAMYNKDYLETFSNILFLGFHNKDAEKWVKENDDKVTAFYKWDNSFTWKR